MGLARGSTHMKQRVERTSPSAWTHDCSMANDIVAQQFARVLKHYPGTTLTDSPSGARLLVIPKMRASEAWSTREIEIRVHVPVGFPCANPVNFWCYPKMRMSDGGHPVAAWGGVSEITGETHCQPMPGFPGEHGTWFAFEAQSWCPQRDSLFTFVKMIEHRLAGGK